MAQFKPSPFNWMDRLPQAERELLTSEMQLIPHASADVYAQAAPPVGTYRLLEGFAYMYVLSKTGQRLLYKRFDAGECFGELATLDGQPYPAFVSVGKTARLAFVSRARVEALRRHSAILDKAFVEAACRYTRTMIDLFINAKTENLEGELWGRLKWLLQYQPPAPCSATLKVNQLELADMLGASRQSVNEALQKLQSRGLISIGRGAVTISDAHAA